MNRAILVLVLLAACRKQTQADSMAGMDMSDTASADSGMAGRAPVRLTPEQARAVGVTFTVVQRGPLVRTVRTVGQVVPAEPNLAEITTKKRLDSAAHSEDTEALLAASRRRLAYWDISRDQVERLERTGEVTKTLALNAPVGGIVLEKMVVAGQAVMPGMKLYRIADLSTIWIEGAVFEQDLGLVRVGAPVSAEFTAYPGRKFTGHVSFVWPTVDDSSRSGRIRVAFPNSGGELRPGMYATLLLEAVVNRDAVNVPAEAVVQTGERNLDFVVGQGGALEPREVVLGARAGDRFQIDSGLAAGERIVASANFLVDAESRLTAGAGSNMPGMTMGTEKRP